MAASAFARSLPASLSSRSLFLKVSPVPIKFSERRSLLRVVQQFGEVEVFKKMEDNSSYIVVMAGADGANKLINATPVYRTFLSHEGSPPSSSSSNSEHALRLVSSWNSSQSPSVSEPVHIFPTDTITETPDPQGARKPDSGRPGAPSGPSKKDFTIRAFPMNKSYSHQKEITQNPLHGPWPEAVSGGDRETFVSAALRMVMPSTIMAPGLRDWHTGQQFNREAFGDAGAFDLDGSAVHEGRAYAEDRRRQRKIDSSVPPVMRSLKAFYEEAHGQSQPKAAKAPGSARIRKPHVGDSKD